MEPKILPIQKKRCAIFVDGFNLYFGVLQHEPKKKWLNIQSFFEELRKDEEVTSVHYFSAIIDEKLAFSERRNRQKQYLSAVGSFSKVNIVLGKYQDREVTCRADCRKVYRVPEEKKTDVNIAVQMMNCAIKGEADLLVLVSGDSDLEPAVKWIRDNYPIVKIAVYIPAMPIEGQHRRNDFYTNIGVACRYLPLDKIDQHQMEKSVVIKEGQIVSRPLVWQ